MKIKCLVIFFAVTFLYGCLAPTSIVSDGEFVTLESVVPNSKLIFNSKMDEVMAALNESVSEFEWSISYEGEDKPFLKDNFTTGSMGGVELAWKATYIPGFKDPDYFVVITTPRSMSTFGAGILVVVYDNSSSVQLSMSSISTQTREIPKLEGYIRQLVESLEKRLQ